MPLFHSPKGQPPGVLTKDKDRVLHYTLTPEGTKQLRATGLRSGDTVPARVLASLIRSGLAHSPRPAEAAGQVRFDFGDDNTADFLPRCELTGTTADLHLVVYGEGNGVVARLLSREPRFLLQKVTTTSIPVAALAPASLAALEATEKSRAAPRPPPPCATGGARTWRPPGRNCARAGPPDRRICRWVNLRMRCRCESVSGRAHAGGLSGCDRIL